MDHILVLVLGFIAQSLFTTRMFVQWIMSERAKKVVSPVLYWQLSLAGSFLFFIYGWFRVDFAIILGQLFSFYIYIWNLNMLNRWKRMLLVFRVLLLLTPPLIISMLAIAGTGAIERLWLDVSFGLLLFGSIGQTIFAFRFIYQWWYSRRHHQSILPDGFWILSTVGSISILVYGIIRKDPVLILGQGAGFLTYLRNIYINRKNKKSLLRN